MDLRFSISYWKQWVDRIIIIMIMIMIIKISYHGLGKQISNLSSREHSIAQLYNTIIIKTTQRAHIQQRRKKNGNNLFDKITTRSYQRNQKNPIQRIYHRPRSCYLHHGKSPQNCCRHHGRHQKSHFHAYDNL